MAEWKSRGFVPDSDEEEDYQEVGVKETNRTESIGETQELKRIGQSTGSQAKVTEVRIPVSGHDGGRHGGLHIHLRSYQQDDEADIDELQQDHYNARPGSRSPILATEEPVDAKPVAHDVVSIPSNVSSPLSEPLSLSDSGQLVALPQSADIAESPIITQRRSRSPDNVHILVPTQTDPQSRLSRNLRQRNPIQLHPYAIESEKYRQILHARGLKALRFARQDSQVLAEDDTQDEEFTAIPSSRSPSLVAQRAIHSLPSSQPDNDLYAEDEFPDVDALLRQSNHYALHGHKRRRIRKPPSMHSARAKTLSPERSQPDGGEIDVHNVPISPPRSGGPAPVGESNSETPKFRVYKRIMPTTLPTPLNSSEPRQASRADFFEHEKLEERSSTPSESSDESEISPVRSEHESSNQLQRVQRKIRGVLPASWLKLDLQAQVKKSNSNSRDRISVSPQKRDVHRGVARPIPRKKGSSNLPTPQHDMFILSDGNDESDTEKQRRLDELISLQTIDVEDDDSIFDSRVGEAPEDDMVDAMLPKVNRSSNRSYKHKKRQKRLFNYGLQFLRTTQGHRKKNTDRSTKALTPSTVYARKTINSGTQPPRLSILDAPLPLHDPPNLSFPPFLKIAKRTARSRRDKGRHSPSRKYIKLATWEDNSDANQTLHGWKKGNIAPQRIKPRNADQLRKPLHPRSSNVALLPAASNAKIPPLFTKQITSKLLKPIIKPGRRHAQPSLDTLLPRQSQENAAPAHEVEHLQDMAQPTNSTGLKGQLVSSLGNAGEFRPAMLETLQEKDDRAHPKTAFRRDLSRIARTTTITQGLAPLWNHFLEEKLIKAPLKETVLDQPCQEDVQHPDMRPNDQSTNSRRRRKRRPRRLDVSTWSAEIDDPGPDVELSTRELCSGQHENFNIREDGFRLTDLGTFSIQYTSTFDISPFPNGTCFHQNTFLGSGEFKRSLGLPQYDMDQHRGFAVLQYEQETFRWGPWNEVVSTELSMLCEKLAKAVQCEPNSKNFERLIRVQRHIANYFSDNLSFFDPVDRVGFIQRCMQVIKSVATETTVDSDLSKEKRLHQSKDDFVSTKTFCLVIANQLRLLSRHLGLSELMRQDAVSFVMDCAEMLQHEMAARLECPEGLMLTPARLRNNSLLIQDDPIMEALVIVRHVLNYDGFVQRRFWESIFLEKSSISENANISVSLLEMSWQKVYKVLPSVEFDVQGLLIPGQRFITEFDNWTTIRKLMNPVLRSYMPETRSQSPSFNTYCRALFSRCLYLITFWGWRRCDSIIGTLFDFFARNGLNHLRNEQSHGSALFLEQLSETLELIADTEDRCFHLLLKIIGSGIRYMRHTYPEKKIRDLVWRLMPNHGRSHPKEQAIRQEDVDALRNHHDLLCTLYWASPPGFHPRLSVIRNLVHIENSHKEACHIHIRAWSNLVRFQLSTNESTEFLVPFTQWHDDLLDQILRQHSLARTEAEDEVKSIQNAQGLVISWELLESTIARNQRQVESLLCDALTCLKRAVQTTHNKEAADMLVSRKLTACFTIFDARMTQTVKPIIEALDVVMSYVKKCSDLVSPSLPASDNEDSQEYGDWTAFAEDDAENNIAQPQYPLLEQVHDPIRHLLSNCFGADVTPPDTLLSKAVQVWAAVGQKLVTVGRKSWSDYVGAYGKDAWKSLRDTEQTRKYTSYFLALLIENDAYVYKENKHSFLRYWMESLVERESLLKYQHRFTSALLNAHPDDALLSNPPFWKRKSPNHFDITAVCFSERRFSLITDILSNMRTTFENAQWQSGANAERLKHEYKDLLKHLMNAMKHNYEELGLATPVRGVYVDFVHKIIESLQQYVSNICPIDRFFTDNVSFPLPATDPAYIVAQLKNYGLRLQDLRAPKELAIFIQSVSERAAIDNQQAYLVDQLYAAMSNSFEVGSSRPSLRTAIVRNILPAYLEIAFRTACGWLLVLPFLEALEKAFKELLIYMDGLHVGSTKSVSSLLTIFLSTMRNSLSPVLDAATLLRKASIVKILRLCYNCVAALLPTLDYLIRLGEEVATALQCIEFFNSFADLFPRNQETIQGRDLFDASYVDVLERAESKCEIYMFVAAELRQTLEKNWICIDNHYFVAKGSSRREVVVDIELLEEEQKMLKKSMEKFREQWRGMPAVGIDDRAHSHEKRVMRGLEDLMI